jgi:hypothetical protein
MLKSPQDSVTIVANAAFAPFAGIIRIRFKGYDLRRLCHPCRMVLSTRNADRLSSDPEEINKKVGHPQKLWVDEITDER